MTAADVNAKNRGYWDGANGNVSSPADAAKPPMRVVTDRKVQVYDPYAHDEVMPTQSDPPDTRSDNLLEEGHGGMDNAVEMYHYGHELGENLAHGEVGDDLIEGSEAGPVEGQADSTSEERIARKQAHPNKVRQDLTPEMGGTRRESAARIVELHKEGIRTGRPNSGRRLAKNAHIYEMGANEPE
jgi:hypothetical protein